MSPGILDLRPRVTGEVTESHSITDAPIIHSVRSAQTSIFDDPGSRPPRKRLHPSGLVVDLFAGGGGASAGIQQTLGHGPDIAINHDPDAVRMHQANHSAAKHYCESVFAVSPSKVCGNDPVALLWASPDCTSHSRARGRTAPVSPRSRSLAWVVTEWAAAVAPRLIVMENVPEFTEWGPVSTRRGPDGHDLTDPQGRPLFFPIESRRGETFREFTSQLGALGYSMDHRVLDVADLGATTSRPRWSLVARRDGASVRWPAATHGPGLAPYAGITPLLDAHRPGFSILNDDRSPRTHRRIADLVRRFVIEGTPAIVEANGRPTALAIAKHYGGVTGHDTNRPLGTITCVDHHGLVTCPLIPGGTAPAVRAYLDRHGSRETRITDLSWRGQRWGIGDITHRMLMPTELARIQGFPSGTVLVGTREEQIRRIGNSVPPVLAAALIAANRDAMDPG